MIDTVKQVNQLLVTRFSRLLPGSNSRIAGVQFSLIIHAMFCITLGPEYRLWIDQFWLLVVTLYLIQDTADPDPVPSEGVKSVKQLIEEGHGVGESGERRDGIDSFVLLSDSPSPRLMLPPAPPAVAPVLRQRTCACAWDTSGTRSNHRGKALSFNATWFHFLLD